VGAPEVHDLTAADGTRLRLTRYQGGSKGPVIAVHGLGVSSLIFSIDTIDTNLLEYLYVAGYDVWLLDFRASIVLPSSNGQFSADDVARLDYPAAVAKVRELTGSPTVQMVVHCFGSTTFFMAMLAGLEGVRSAVCSQIGAHVLSPPLTEFKAGIHLDGVLRRIGVNSLDAYVDSHADWKNRIFDEGLRFFKMPPGEDCKDPVCHRISFIYSLLYQHEQLNQATHDALHEMFGIANASSLSQLAEMVRKGHLVDADGHDAYLPNVKRLAIPIAILHGEKNDFFLPESTERTLEWMQAANGRDLYTRRVIPGYGHIDCIYGKNAARDVYPFVLEHLNATQ
jgi:cholesterol oxidase